MREILFRVWDTKEKKMIHDIRLLFSNYLNQTFEEMKECGCEVIQYIGLKDRNGVKIFEGDIIKCSSGHVFIIKYGEHGNSAYTDCIELGYYAYCTDEKKRYRGLREDLVYWINEERGEVIGNIYENHELLPELLEVEE